MLTIHVIARRALLVAYRSPNIPCSNMDKLAGLQTSATYPIEPGEDKAVILAYAKRHGSRN